MRNSTRSSDRGLLRRKNFNLLSRLLFLQLSFRSSVVKRKQHNDRSISIIKQFQFLAYFPSFPLSRFLFPDRNEPGRFFGDGVSFKAKLIGILEVGEARGDRMCQEALQVLERPTKGWRGFCLSFYVYFMLKGNPPHTAQDQNKNTHHRQ